MYPRPLFIAGEEAIIHYIKHRARSFIFSAPQIPSAWSDASITAQANLGRLPCPGTAYLYVFDAAGSRNAEGFPVEISCEPVTSDETPDSVEPPETPPDMAGDEAGEADARPDTAVDGSSDTGLDPEADGPSDSGNGGCGCRIGP